MEIRNESNINKMTLDMAKEKLPYVVIKLLHGAEVLFDYENKDDIVCIKFDGTCELLHKEDYLNCKIIAEVVYKEWIVANNISTSYSTVKNTMEIHSIVAKRITEVYENKFKGKKKILFIKGDNGACGYWRMVLPARYLPKTDYIVDVTNAKIAYEYLLGYDVIVIQRTCDWNSYYVLRKLHDVGKKIVYDIDDNLFELPDHHPSLKYFSNDSREAASAIMLLVDRISVTTERLKQIFAGHLGDEIEKKTFVIPNALDTTPFHSSRVLDTKIPFRVLWTGGASHEQDLALCLSALKKFFKNHRDCKLTLMGFLPKVISNDMQFWNGVVEYVDFKDVESYFSMLPRLCADIGICPLVTNNFNAGKSPIKWVEYSLAGLPVIASNCSPYSDDIVNGVNGCLANNDNEWFELLLDKYKNRTSAKWTNMVIKAKEVVANKYNICNEDVIWKWKNLLNL